MFFLNHAYRNGLAYLLWRWLLKNNGKFVSSLDSYFFGPSRGFNDYNKLAQEYKESNIKPDKQYSILPTVLSMAGDCREKRIIDMGCGNGFFTVPLADKGAEMVWGIDNSQKQINFARRRVPLPNVKYVCADVFVDQLPQIDLVIAPFVANYARTASILKHFFKQIYSSLSTKGKLVLVRALQDLVGVGSGKYQVKSAEVIDVKRPTRAFCKTQITRLRGLPFAPRGEEAVAVVEVAIPVIVTLRRNVPRINRRVLTVVAGL